MRSWLSSFAQTIFNRIKGYFLTQLWCRGSGEVKHSNLISNNFIRVKSRLILGVRTCQTHGWRKTKKTESKDHETITKTLHELMKQRKNITGSYTEVNPKFPPWTDNEVDASNVRPSSERIQELWIVCAYRGGWGAKPLVEKWWFEHINKWIEREAFIDSSSPCLKINFCSSFRRLKPPLFHRCYQPIVMLGIRLMLDARNKATWAMCNENRCRNELQFPADRIFTSGTQFGQTRLKTT